MFYPINNVDFCKYVYSESNASNTFQISWDSGNTKLGKQVKGQRFTQKENFEDKKFLELHSKTALQRSTKQLKQMENSF